MPDFLLVGAQKCGTTSLAAYLQQHPQVRGALGKEVHYFDGGTGDGVDNWQKGPRWYRAHYPLRFGQRPLVFEATPMYLFHPEAAERIQAMLPSAKILVLLRDPVRRAISHYHHSVNRGHEHLPMLEAMLAEDDRLAGAAAGDTTALRRYSYKHRGLYADQLRRYLERFPAAQVQVLRSEDLFSDAAAVVREVLAFVGADPGVEIADATPRNVSGNQAPPPQDVLDLLGAYYEEPNQALYQLLGRDLGW